MLTVLLDLLFPPKCPFCRRIVETSGPCPECVKSLPWIPREKVPESGLRCAAPLWYEGRVREALLRIKFSSAPGAAEPVGRLLAQCAAEEFGGEFDTVTWVPLGRRRLWKRGYDQARLLAESACRVWGVKPVRLLRKAQENRAQSTVGDAAARRANVLGVYEVPKPAQVQGRRILLVDDICTTGATLAECARELRLAGAASVVCVTAARTPERKKRKTNSCNPEPGPL